MIHKKANNQTNIVQNNLIFINFNITALIRNRSLQRISISVQLPNSWQPTWTTISWPMVYAYSPLKTTLSTISSIETGQEVIDSFPTFPWDAGRCSEIATSWPYIDRISCSYLPASIPSWKRLRSYSQMLWHWQSFTTWILRTAVDNKWMSWTMTVYADQL